MKIIYILIFVIYFALNLMLLRDIITDHLIVIPFAVSIWGMYLSIKFYKKLLD
jgi:hypothetical protein